MCQIWSVSEDVTGNKWAFQFQSTVTPDTSWELWITQSHPLKLFHDQQTRRLVSFEELPIQYRAVYADILIFSIESKKSEYFLAFSCNTLMIAAQALVVFKLFLIQIQNH
jgi:hypothetical protein